MVVGPGVWVGLEELGGEGKVGYWMQAETEVWYFSIPIQIFNAMLKDHSGFGRTIRDQVELQLGIERITVGKIMQKKELQFRLPSSQFNQQATPTKPPLNSVK